MELLIFLFKSRLQSEEIIKIAEKRALEFGEVKGLIQKYYVSDDKTNQVGGIYIFDSKESLETFRNSDLSKSAPEAYKFVEPPEVRRLEILMTLKEQEELFAVAE